jgi:membrane-bound acyltransferase YfiQ involved in biofilm formation
MNSLFLTNYEVSKLNIEYPNITNIVILVFLILMSFLWTRKQTTTFLDRDQTDQLRGGSILLVIVTHLWAHVSTVEAVPGVGGYGVVMFLLIAGFGLASSRGDKTFVWTRFLSRRLRRVMMPYWIITPVWLLADYFLLDKIYTVQDVTLTMAGMNFYDAIAFIDYTRWYITSILLWYIAFALTNQFMSRPGAILSLFGFGVLLLILKVYRVIPLGNHPIQMFAFPLGMVMATYKNNISDWLSNGKNRLTVLIGSTSLLIVSGVTILFLDRGSASRVIYYGVGDIAKVAWSILFVMSVALLGRYGYMSSFLKSWGKVSYGAFLIHGPLLIKYNPIMGWFPSYAVAVSMVIFIAMVWVVSYCFHAFVDVVWNWLERLPSLSLWNTESSKIALRPEMAPEPSGQNLYSQTVGAREGDFSKSS